MLGERALSFAPNKPVCSAKGRNAELNASRNELLCARYYYYQQYTKYRYDYIIELLSAEFFLSDIRTARVLLGNGKILQELRQQAPTIQYFKKLWPHLVW